MGKIIIVIHGLRNKPPKDLLLEWVSLSIQEGLNYVNTNVQLPKMELVYWADIMHEKPLSFEETNKKSPYYIDEKYIPQQKIKGCKQSILRQFIIHTLKKIIYAIFLKKDFSLRFKKISDKFIHYNFSDLEVYFNENCEANAYACKQRDDINNRLITLLEKYKNDEIFLIAHSMGSIIAFDVLNLISSNIRINTFISMGSPLGAPFVLSRIARLYKSNMQEHIKLQTPETVYKHWYNFADIKDTIAMDYKLSEEFSENSKGVKVKDFLVRNTYKFEGKANHHKSFGYLRTPEFIKVLSNFINE